MLKIMGKIFQLVLLPLIIAGAFFIWSIPRIETDYNFNTDEFIYLTRSTYWSAYQNGDFNNPIWSEWGSYDQPQLTNYIYASVPGDRSLLQESNSICQPDDQVNAWSCLGGRPINTWPDSISSIKEMIIDGRLLATAISSLVLATTYFLGFVVGGPVTGILAALFLGWFSFFKNLSTMMMMDQILLVFLNLQLIITLLMAQKKRTNLFLTALLGITTGLAFSTKLSAFIPTLIAFGYLLFANRTNLGRQVLHMGLAGLLAISIFLSLHPHFWTQSIEQAIKMVTWRTKQIALQQSSDIKPSNILDKVSYTLEESFTSWRHEGEPQTIIALAILGLINLTIMAKTKTSFATIALLNIATFVLVLPLKWNRYLLPIMPLLGVIFGYLPIVLKSILYFVQSHISSIKQFSIGATTALALLGVLFLFPGTNYLALGIFTLTLLLLIQGYLVTRAMLFGFSNHKTSELPETTPSTSFSLIVPARDEDQVIGQTIHALSKLDYPQDLYEVLVIIRADDYKTIAATDLAIKQTKLDNIRIVQIDGDAHNKSYSLNIGLKLAKHDVIGIFDAEDEPHTNILQAVNNYFNANQEIGVVQAPVHLTNINSSWFASLNAIEYYYWFRSVLPYLSTKQIVLLGGNTIFTKKAIYRQVGVYDETCLTEDADLGVRLARHKIKIGILDDPAIATKEEAPNNEAEVIKQRSRWDQGYLQVIEKSHWSYLSITQRFYALYTLSQPLFRHLSFLNMVATPLLASLGQIPLWIVLFSFTPAYFLIIQLGMYLLGLRELSQIHNLRLSVWRYVSTIVVFIPYQALLTLATFRAIGKILLGNYSWDKTSHNNSHRPSLAILE